MFDPPRPRAAPETATPTMAPPMWTLTPTRAMDSAPPTEPFRSVADDPSLPKNVIPLRAVKPQDAIEDAELVIDGQEFDELLVSVERIEDPDELEALSLATTELEPSVTGTTVDAIRMLDQQRVAARSASSAPDVVAEPTPTPKSSDSIVDQPAGRTASAPKRTESENIVDAPRHATSMETAQQVTRFVGSSGLPPQMQPGRRKLSETMWFMVGEQPWTLARHEAEELEFNSLDRLNHDYMARQLPDELREIYTLGD